MSKTITEMNKDSPVFICCHYKWTFPSSDASPSNHEGVTLFLTDFLTIPAGLMIDKAFCLGAEVDSDERLIKLCYVNSVELGRLGFVARSVSCVLREKGSPLFPSHSKLRVLKSVNGNPPPSNNSLFIRNISSTGMPPTNYYIRKPTLTFRLYFSELVKQYAPSRFDVYLGDQLWNAAINKKGTDFDFQVFDSSFPTHKFVLAARCPIFRAMFDTDMMESRTGRVNIVDIDAKTFEQFLRFLYTGQLSEPATEELGIVAEKYQVETLVSLCRTAVDVQKIHHDGLQLFAAPTAKINDSEVKKTVQYARQINTRNPSWHQADLLHSRSYTAHNVAEHIDKPTRLFLDKHFFYKLESTGDNRNRKVCFYSSWRNGLSWRVAAVDLFVVSKEQVQSEEAMDPLITQENCDKQPVQIFTKRISSYDCEHPSSFFRFVVHFVPTVGSYDYRLRDSLFLDEIWSSAVNKERTDVEFKVGGKIFPAHRALLAARCPALAALVPVESSLVAAQISSMDPEVFGDLLYFLYTGSVKNPITQDLLEVARSYEVETLTRLAVANQQQMDQDQFSQVIMSVFC